MVKIIGDRNRTSAYDPGLAERMNRQVEEELRREELERRLEEARRKREPAVVTPPTEPAIVQPPPTVDSYILMPQTTTYALGMEALRQACIQENNQHQPQITLPDGRKLYRANTFLENIEARMNDWETLHDSAGNERTLEDRKRYFVTWLDSSCGIAYKAKTTKLKLQLICPSLMGIAKDFNEDFLPVDYASFKETELDSNSKNFVRDGWLALLDGRTDVYTDYLKMLKTITKRDITPNFWACSKSDLKTDELRAVCVSSLDNYSNAMVTTSSTITVVSFVVVAPS